MDRYFVCRFYEEEFKQVLKESDVCMYIFKLNCDEEKNVIIRSQINDHIYHGSCLKIVNNKSNPIQNCLSWSIDQKNLTNLMNKNDFIVTGRWLKYWKDVIEKHYGFNSMTAKLFFSQHFNKVIFFDNHLYNNYLNELKKFSDFIGLAYEIIDNKK